MTEESPYVERPCPHLQPLFTQLILAEEISMWGIVYYVCTELYQEVQPQGLIHTVKEKGRGGNHIW